MTSTATHVGSSFGPRVTSMVGAEELKLMSRFPHRERPSTWEATAVTREEVLERLARPPLRAVEPSAQANRMFGARLVLDWLMTLPGETWQQRWQRSPAHGQHIASQGWRNAFVAWAGPEGRVSRRETLLVGVLALLCADAVRPDPEFLIGSTDCAHEHACVRCPVLIVHATERPRLVEIRDNLLTRILEAEREGWLGEIEGLQSSLAHAEEKLARLDAQISRKQESVDMGIPTFREIAARTSGVATPPGPA